MAHAWNASNGTLLPGEKNGDTRQRKAGVPGNRDIGTEALLTHAETADGVGRLEGDTLKAPSTVLVHWDHPSVAPDGVTFVPSIWDQSNPRATTIVSHSAAYPSYGPPACLLQPEEIGYLRNAVLSLYADQIRPYQSEVVRRLKLFEPTALVIQNALHFYRILTDIFIVEKTNHSRMVVYLRTKPTWFQGWIDPKSAEDPYKPSMWNELRQYLSGLSFVTSILRELVDSKSSPRTLNCTEVLRETGEIAADEFAMALSPSAALLFFGIRRALRDGRHQDKEELVESTAGSHRVVHPRTRNTSVSLRLTAEGKTTERPPEESPVPFQKTTANAMTPPDRLAHMHEFCCPTDTVPNSCSPAAALRPSSPSSFREKMLLPASPWQIAGQKLGSQSAGTVVLASSHFFSALKDASHHVARSVSSRSSSPISPSSQTSASPVSPLCLHANAEVSYEAFAPSVEVSESVGGPRPPCKDRSLASCFASCSLHARQEEAIRTLVQAVLLEARTSTTNDGTLETSTQSARRDDTPADTLPQERETAAVDSPVLRTSQFRGEKAIEPTESTRSEISAGNSRAATGKLHLPLPVAPGCTPGPRASAYSGSLAPSVLKREEQGIDESVPSRFKDRGRVKEGSEARLEDDGAWRREPELQNSTASLLQLPRSTEFRTLSDSLTESYQSDSASPASSIRSKAQGESALPEYATGLETLVSVALPLARGVALRVQSALAAGLEPDTFSRGRYGTAVALKRHGPVSLR
ncbi:ost-hth associated domain protein [Cystoisospora suis]|uniref:Ost-hth associated domain protein n=1 Tax=Cystoisospora suis TaxID=483139 RepID=A0A2C6L245_9APIC|nr:ost-hth associated domain protein [Cystoisospora suis]